MNQHSRPIFLRRSRRLVVQIRQIAIAASIITLTAFSAGFFFGG